MAFTVIDKPTAHFNVKTYTGSGTTNAITGIGFKPDWLWLKRIDATETWSLYDVIRGVSDRLEINTNQSSVTTVVTSFDSDGFTLDNNVVGNITSAEYVAYCYKAGGVVSADNNTEGNETNTCSANAPAGISVNDYTGRTTVSTRGHGLGAKPGIMMFKVDHGRNVDWFVWHDAIPPANLAGKLNTTYQSGSYVSAFNSTDPTSTLFTTGTADETNESPSEIACYIFAPVKGFSKFSYYLGNADVDGPFVFTGFRPAMVMIKNTQNAGNWYRWDNKRLGYNVDNNALYPNTTGAQQTDDDVDFLSNGFKLRNAYSHVNGSGNKIIYSAFAEFPLVSTNKISGVAR